MNLRFLKPLLKLVLTGVAVWVVVRKIDLAETWGVLASLQWGWLISAVVFFNLSKVVSAFRLREFLRALQIDFSATVAVKLCYAGMFYNLFLPGGIGGDGYKVYLLKRQYGDTTVKKIVSAALLDRVSGMTALVFLALILFLGTSASGMVKGPWLAISIVSALLFYPLVYLGNGFMFKSFRSAFFKADLQSLGVQVLQLVCAYFILLSVGIGMHHLDYLELFLLSSVVAVLPFTIGGIGARELVFIYGYEFLPIDKNAAVAFSIVFFLITAASSLTGAFLKIRFEAKDQKSS